MFIIIIIVCCYYLGLLHCHSLRKALSSKPYNVSASFFCGVTADETCRYELLRVEHKFRYVDESIYPKLICYGLFAFHTNLSLEDLITLVLLYFDISNFLEYLFLWLGC